MRTSRSRTNRRQDALRGRATSVEFSRPTRTTSIDDLDQIHNTPGDSPRTVRFDERIGEPGTSGDSNDKYEYDVITIAPPNHFPNYRNYVERPNNAAQTLLKAYDLLSEDVRNSRVSLVKSSAVLFS